MFRALLTLPCQPLAVQLLFPHPPLLLWSVFLRRHSTSTCLSLVFRRHLAFPCQPLTVQLLFPHILSSFVLVSVFNLFLPVSHVPALSYPSTVSHSQVSFYFITSSSSRLGLPVSLFSSRYKESSVYPCRVYLHPPLSLPISANHCSISILAPVPAFHSHRGLLVIIRALGSIHNLSRFLPLRAAQREINRNWDAHYTVGLAKYSGVLWYT